MFKIIIQPALCIILCIITICCKGQEAHIILNSTDTIKTLISASSDNTLYTKRGNVNIEDIREVIFKHQDEKYSAVYQRLQSEGIPFSYNSEVQTDDAELEKNIDDLFKSGNSNYIEYLPFTEQGKLELIEVIEVNGVNADELYSRARIFFAETFKSANEVIQMDDEGQNTIIAKGWSPALNRRMHYTIKIETKDGRLRYSIYDIYYELDVNTALIQMITETTDEHFRKSNYYKNNGKPKNIPERMMQATKHNLITLRESLIQAVSNSSNEGGDDW